MKPCPHCGDEAILETKRNEHHWIAWVECLGCDM